MHKLMRYIKGYEKQALLAPLFKMLEACFELFVPLVIASIIDTGIKNEDAAFIWTRCGLLVLLAAIGLASSLTAQWFSAKAALGFGTALRKDLFRHIGTLSYSELDGIGTPTLVTRMTSDINQVQNGSWPAGQSNPLLCPSHETNWPTPAAAPKSVHPEDLRPAGQSAAAPGL